MNKKTVFVLVEGLSDKLALQGLFDSYFQGQNLYIHVEGGDITTKMSPRSDRSTILNMIGERISRYTASYDIERRNIAEIIHIVDTDGAYIRDDFIIDDDSAQSPQYSENAIRTSNPLSLSKRNKQKRSCLDKLISTRQIWKIPYHVYYMSCNLDHVLHGHINLEKTEKIRKALNFARRYSNNLTGFLDFLNSNQLCVSDDFYSTWNYIKKNNHSLERHSNINICFTESGRE